MASRFDLAPRLAAIQAQGLIVETAYQGTPARWLVDSLRGRDAFVVNAKGINADNTVVLIRLSRLEKLLGVTNG